VESQRLVGNAEGSLCDVLATLVLVVGLRMGLVVYVIVGEC
jgi:hypothetical protein